MDEGQGLKWKFTRPMVLRLWLRVSCESLMSLQRALWQNKESFNFTAFHQKFHTLEEWLFYIYIFILCYCTIYLHAVQADKPFSNKCQVALSVGFWVREAAPQAEKACRMNIDYVYMHTNISLLFRIWQYSECDTVHVNNIFLLYIFKLGFIPTIAFLIKTCGIGWYFSGFWSII